MLWLFYDCVFCYAMPSDGSFIEVETYSCGPTGPGFVGRYSWSLGPTNDH